MQISNERYELVSKATSDSIWDWDIETDHILRLGETFRSIFGYSNQESYGNIQLWESIIHPEDFPMVSASIYKAINNPKEIYWEEEFRVEKADGNYSYVKDKGYIIRDTKGKAIRMIGATQDINKVKESELALVENIKSLEDYKFALNQSAIISITNEMGIILSVNENFVNISGYNEKELVGKTHKIVKSTYHTKSFYDEMWNSINSGKVWHGNFKNKKKSGEFYWVSSTIIPFINNENKPFQFLSIMFNITERKNAEEALIISNERYNLVSKATNDSIWDWNIITNEVTRTGEGFKVLFGYELSNKNISNINWKDLIHPDDLQKVQDSLDNAFNNSNISYWEQEYRFLKANGRYANVNDKGYIIRDKSGVAIRIIGATQDITERVNHMNAIEAQNKKLRQIAWDQSHIVRAPLSRMMAIVSLLKELSNTSPEFKEWVKHFDDSSVELDKVIREITSKSEELNLDF